MWLATKSRQHRDNEVMKKDTLVGPLDLYDLQGKTIVEVVVGCITFTVKKGKIPSKRYMPNFKIEAVGNKTMSLMVLDNYGVGDNGADEELLRHTDFGGALSNLVINTITGEIYSGSFYRNKGKLGLYFQSMPFNGTGHWPKVPPEFLPRLNELLTEGEPAASRGALAPANRRGFSSALAEIVLDYYTMMV